jgi:hypothetical protein
MNCDTFSKNILNEWKKFDAFLNSLKGDAKKSQYAFLIRNLYVANFELKRLGWSIFDIIFTVRNLFRSFFSFFLKKPYVKRKEDVFLLEIGENDQALSRKIKVPLFKMEMKWGFDLRQFWIFFSWLIVVFRLFLAKPLNNFIVLKCLTEMLRGVQVLHYLDLSGVKIIITQRDRYPVEQAIVFKGKEQGVVSVRIEDFPLYEKIFRDTIICDYYFCPNKTAEDIWRSFEQNKTVCFIPGGFPFWDVLADYPYNPHISPRIVSYWTTYADKDIISDSYDFSLYINELINALPLDAVLYIKVHPLDDFNRYRTFQSEKVKLIRHGEIDNWKLVSISSFVFSIMSTVSYQAKHICPGSFFINFEPVDSPLCGYEFIENYIDIIRTKDELKAFLSGQRQPKAQGAFLSFFNPGYPKNSEKLSIFIDSLHSNILQVK